MPESSLGSARRYRIMEPRVDAPPDVEPDAEGGTVPNARVSSDARRGKYALVLEPGRANGDAMGVAGVDVGLSGD